MSQPVEHKPVPFFVGLIISENLSEDKVQKALEDAIGEIDFTSEKIDFSEFTDYYESEMGKNLFRRWIAFKDMRKPEEIVDMKWRCAEIEKKFAKDGNRLVNIDPGYLTEAKIILASFKNFSHRIYLSRCVFADMQLMFVGGKYVPMRWTFSDYKSDVAQKFFIKLREKYRLWLKSKG